MIPDVNAVHIPLAWRPQAALTAVAPTKKPSSKRAYPAMASAAITLEKLSAWIPLCETPSYIYCNNATATGMGILSGILSQESGSRERAMRCGNKNWPPAPSAFARPETKSASAEYFFFFLPLQRTIYPLRSDTAIVQRRTLLRILHGQLCF